MSYRGCALTLPIESEYEEQMTYADVILLNVEPDDKKSAKLFEGQPMIHYAAKANQPKFNRLKFVWVMIRWHFFLYLAITSSLYATFHYGFGIDQKDEILKAIAFCADWRQMAFFLGVYISFSVKKVQDIISVSSCYKPYFAFALKSLRKF